MQRPMRWHEQLHVHFESRCLLRRRAQDAIHRCGCRMKASSHPRQRSLDSYSRFQRVLYAFFNRLGRRDANSDTPQDACQSKPKMLAASSGNDNFITRSSFLVRSCPAGLYMFSFSNIFYVQNGSADSQMRTCELGFVMMLGCSRPIW